MPFDGLMQRETMLPTSLFAIAFVRPASLVRCLINKLLKMVLHQPMMVAVKIRLNSLTIFLRTSALMVTNYRHWSSLTSTRVFLFVMGGMAIETSLLKSSVSIVLKTTTANNRLKRHLQIYRERSISCKRLHLLASTEQSQLHSLISDLKSKLTDAYVDSKVSKQNCILDCFNKN